MNPYPLQNVIVRVTYQMRGIDVFVSENYQPSGDYCLCDVVAGEKSGKNRVSSSGDVRRITINDIEGAVRI